MWKQYYQLNFSFDYLDAISERMLEICGNVVVVVVILNGNDISFEQKMKKLKTIKQLS